MTPRILIIGYQRSGTTLLRRLMQAHPVVHRMYHETWLLTGYTPLPNLPGKVWGEKVAFAPSSVEKQFAWPHVVNYCELWRQQFKDDAKILHILRHPLDCALSAANLGWAKTAQHALIRYTALMTKVFDHLPFHDKVYYTFKYEDLIWHPVGMLRKIFAHCDIASGGNIASHVANTKMENLGINTKVIDKTRGFSYMNWGKYYPNLKDGKRQMHRLRTTKIDSRLAAVFGAIGEANYEW